jgi:DNA-binding CsgD family transcriptional regulator
MALFGLTAAEARLSAGLARGQNLEELSERYSVSLNTARTHLKRIFNKTGVCSQGELIKLLLTSIATVGSDSVVTAINSSGQVAPPATSGTSKTIAQFGRQSKK